MKLEAAKFGLQQDGMQFVKQPKVSDVSHTALYKQ
jgi:hypothetical protein